MNLFPKHIILNRKQRAITDLLQQQNKSKFAWEKEWLDFLKEWYNDQDFIEVNTSGSTGHPKIICLKKNFVAASAQRTIQYFNLKENDPILHCLPARYIAGKLMIVRALLGKLDLHVVDPSTDFSFLKTTHFKFASMVPNQVIKLLDVKLETRNPEFLLIGGSSVPRSLEKQLQNIPTTCYSSYGMTETATHIALRKINGNGADEFYSCLDDIQVRLSKEACLQIFMHGLNQNFLQTTDLAELHNEKTFKVLGRADNMIISGGIKFSPEQLEKKLEPYISRPFLISSLPHNRLGQQLILIIEGKEDQAIRIKLQSICQQQFEKFEQPRQIQFISELPRTITGKLNRKALK